MRSTANKSTTQRMNPSWQSRNFAWSGCNRDVREAFLCIRFVEPGRSIWHLFQTDFTEIMLLFWDGFLLFHTFFRLYNAGQMFFGGASSKATPRPTRLCRVGLGVLWVERTGTVLNYLLLHEAVRLLLQLSDETECGKTKKVFSGLSVKVVKGHTVVSRAESNNEIKTLYKPPVKKLLRNEKSATSIFGVEIALCNLK